MRLYFASVVDGNGIKTYWSNVMDWVFGRQRVIMAWTSIEAVAAAKPYYPALRAGEHGAAGSVVFSDGSSIRGDKAEASVVGLDRKAWVEMMARGVAAGLNFACVDAGTCPKIFLIDGKSIGEIETLCRSRHPSYSVPAD